MLYQKKGWLLFLCSFVESRPEEQLDGHDLVVCELRTINLTGAVGKRELLCHVSLMLARVFSHLTASQRAHVAKQCVRWRAGVENQVGQDKVICPVYTSQDIRAPCCHLPEWGLQDPSCLRRLSLSTLAADQMYETCFTQKHLCSMY